MTATTLTLYSKAGCHLCDEMKDTVQPLAQELGCALEYVDIDGNAELEERFGWEIPVLFVNGRKAFKYRVSERELRRHLRGLGDGATR